ncbi:GNAT family N-acetyltransferase [Bacillus sp. SG-1]|uniref:GNAT family N-acetyltransferase n=1 Tax=Bacillus sp. SG-1 TaxID=161544 RepID=UPI000154361F|nr:GNAT family N-acetyltransferase [Bacillus sp. SG-1]EDL66301.1 acetyltransferase, GNAT family protein [Bacillus sp. SG-1]
MNLHVNGRMFTIRKAKQEDISKVLSLLVEAAEWLKTKGTTQWNYYLTDLEGNMGEVMESINRQNTYLAEIEREAVASLTLEEEPGEWDMEIWGVEAAQGDAVYMHRLVVNREYAGLGLGEALIEWAKNEVNHRGKKYIRFDCLYSNDGLNSFYQRHNPLKGVADVYGKHSKYEITF